MHGDFLPSLAASCYTIYMSDVVTQGMLIMKGFELIFIFSNMANAPLQNEKAVERPLNDTQAVDETQPSNDVDASDPERSPRSLYSVKIIQQTQTRNNCRSRQCG